MNENYGMKRVIDPDHVLPTSAWKLDNNGEIHSDEIRVSIKKVHIEQTSFKQICLEANNDEEKIKEKITDIIMMRGKLHNPVTDTGGVLYGVVEKIGCEYNNNKNLKEGDEVICNASLATIPVYISRITNVDMAYTQIDAEGYAILFNEIPIVKRPEGLPVNLALFTFNESGTLYRVSNLAKDKHKFLVVGNNLMSNILFGYVIRKTIGESAEIACLIDKRTDLSIKGESIDRLIEKVFNEVHYVNILKPMECLQGLNADSLFDVSVNCADIPGAETINVLATKEGGSVVFANLISNYNIALYITESISRQLNIRCAAGYLERYDEFDIEIVEDLAPYLKDVQMTHIKVEDNLTNKSQKNMEKAMIYSEDFICESRSMATVLGEVMKVAKYDCNVLITGDTGVGKEKIANVIQKNSVRKMQPFMKINCAAIAQNLMESEFFGYEKGSFTGANATGKKGYFEMADNGTIFLDEVGELPLDIQAKLLRVIQDGEFFRVGGTNSVKTNVRILSATNRNLEEFVEDKLFRRDLFYRLNVFPIKVPSLQERREDIPALIRFFIKKYGEKFEITKTISEDAIEYLKARNWLGNIRELENFVQRLLISTMGDKITLFDVTKELHAELFAMEEHLDEDVLAIAEEVKLTGVVDGFESNIIKYACEKYGSTRKAAKAIGISQTQMVRKKKKYNIE